VSSVGQPWLLLLVVFKHFTYSVLLARGISAELLEQLAQNRALVQAIAAERQEQTVDMLLFFYILSAAIVFKT